MSSDRLGLVGGLAADRSVLVTIVLAFGFSALAIAGVSSARDAGVGSAGFADMLIALLLLPTLPLALAAAAPKRARFRAVFAAVICLGFFAADALAANLPDAFGPPDRRLFVAGAGLALLLTLLAPASGAYLRLAFLGALGVVLGAAGAAGLVRLEPRDIDIAAPIALGAALAMPVVVSVVAEFVALFARGADRRSAAGRAAREAAGLAIFAVILAVAVPLRGAGFPIEADVIAGTAWISGVSTLMCALGALFITAAALALHEATENVAVEENARAQAQRAFWRPLRKALPLRSAFAALAILAIVCVAMAFDLAIAPAAADVLFTVAATLGAVIAFFSIRSGVFVLGAFVLASVLTSWVGRAVGAEPPPALWQAAALAFAAVLFGQLAVAWRDARSPRLNPRETMELAMTDGAGRFIVSLAAGVAAFYAVGVAAENEGAVAAAGYASFLALIGGVVAPALMTALSGARFGERD